MDVPTGDTEILSRGNSKETATQIHMNSAKSPLTADKADVIGDTFTRPVTGNSDDNDEVRDKDFVVIDGLRVTADCNKSIRS